MGVALSTPWWKTEHNEQKAIKFEGAVNVSTDKRSITKQELVLHTVCKNYAE